MGDGILLDGGTERCKILNFARHSGKTLLEGGIPVGQEKDRITFTTDPSYPPIIGKNYKIKLNNGKLISIKIKSFDSGGINAIVI